MFGKLFPRMYTGVVAGLIDGRHHERLGPAWMLFVWCVMRQTGQGIEPKTGKQQGPVAGGNIVTYAEIAEEMNCKHRSVREWMPRLVREKYLRVEHDRRGIRIFVLNPKKFRVPENRQSKSVMHAGTSSVRVPEPWQSEGIHPVENTVTSETTLRNDLTKLPKNNNKDSLAKNARSDFFFSLRKRDGKAEEHAKRKDPARVGRKAKRTAPARRRDHAEASARTATSGGVGLAMLLTTQQSYKLLAKHGVFAREICDRCGAVLGAVRFTRKDELGIWCSRACRGDGERQATRKTGRPRKYRNGEESRAAKTRQQRNYRSRPSVEKTVCIQSETKDLQAQKTPLSNYPLTRPLSAQETAYSENGGARV